ncbi:P-loop NTPase [Myxococcus eversor]|uniref:P-loop NTPase n=1 Tax=Myxococcus eversor TaxID=2709661 RepID=UPI0013D55FE7|nr:P-loop NTPase [Myxococcus eversor]
MTGRTIALHVFASAKGGVGKSTLAIACAKLLSEEGRTCVLLDADFTGTSLADGLLLCAPLVASADGALDFYAPPTQRFLSREETIRLRMRRKDATLEEQFPAPPFLNDIFLHGDLKQECQIEALCWRHEDRDDRVLYLPSSPLGKDIGIALGWLFRDQAFTWLQRLTWLLEGMASQQAALTDVVIDLPPGLHGFAHEVLVLLSYISSGREMPTGFPAWHEQRDKLVWEARPFLITTPDRNDVILALEYYARHRKDLSELRVLLNRNVTTSIEQLRTDIRAYTEVEIGLDQVPLTVIGFLSPLSKVFQDRTLRLNPEVRALKKQLRVTEEG